MLNRPQRVLNQNSNTLYNEDELMRRVVTLEKTLSATLNNTNQNYVGGRNRLNRGIPSSSSDVVSTDQLGDRVVVSTGEYILFNNSGTPTWLFISGTTSF